MSTAQVPVPVPNPAPGDNAAIELDLVAFIQNMVASQNKVALAAYAAEIATYIKTWGTNAAENAQAPAPPAPPLVGLVDPDTVRALFDQANAIWRSGTSTGIETLNWAAAVTYVQAPAIPIKPPENVIVIGGPVIGAPSGFYATASGDASQVPNGYKIEQDGKTYVAVHVGFMGAVWWQLQP